MLKKLIFAAIIFTAGECVAYATVNTEALKLAKRDASPPFVLPPSKPFHYLWVDMSTDPSQKHTNTMIK